MGRARTGSSPGRAPIEDSAHTESLEKEESAVDPREASDRWEIRNAIDEYASALDDRDVARLVDVFTDDAYFFVSPAGSDESLVSYSGPSGIAEVMELLSGFGETFHVMLNHQASVAGDTATSLTYCSANHLIGDPPQVNLEMHLKYKDELKRTSDGWKIARRQVIRYWQEVHKLLDASVEQALGEALQAEDIGAAVREWAPLALRA
jgi:ketosteroid isomerase-like protein